MRLDDLECAFHSFVIYAKEKRRVSVEKETACGRDLGDLIAFRSKTGIHKVSVIIVYNRNNQFHKTVLRAKIYSSVIL